MFLFISASELNTINFFPELSVTHTPNFFLCYTFKIWWYKCSRKYMMNFKRVTNNKFILCWYLLYTLGAKIYKHWMETVTVVSSINFGLNVMFMSSLYFFSGLNFFGTLSFTAVLSHGALHFWWELSPTLQLQMAIS